MKLLGFYLCLLSLSSILALIEEPNSMTRNGESTISKNTNERREEVIDNEHQSSNTSSAIMDSDSEAQGTSSETKSNQISS